MDKLTMYSMDIVKENIRKIGEIFPDCLIVVKNENGELEEKIDLKKFEANLKDSFVEDAPERYEFNWPGKSKARAIVNQSITSTLRPCMKESVNFDTTENLYIEGDNLDVLKLLRETYYGKVKMIYIDPPYNTGGKDNLLYKDNYWENREEYLTNSGQYDCLANRLTKNLESNGRFHTDWLNEIYPRLKIARELLSEDGVIFISIDDHECHNLRKVCDEIFNEKNFEYCLSVVNNLNGNDNSSGMMETQESCLIYAKNKTKFEFGVLQLEEEEAPEWKVDEFGFWKKGRGLKATGENAAREDRPNCYFPVYINETTLEISVDEKGPGWYELLPITDGREMRWYWNKAKFRKDSNEVIVTRTRGRYSLYKKQRPSVGDLPSRRGKTTFYNPKYSNAYSTNELKLLFGRKVFDYAKSSYLIKDLIRLGNCGDDDIILDFFSGSATTAQAVIDLNSEDGKRRKFIMVQLPTPCNPKKEAYKAGYRNLCDIGKARIRLCGERVIQNWDSDHPGEPIVDVGFRVMKLDSSNMENVFYCPQDLTQAQLAGLCSNIKADRTDEDLLFQVMLEMGVVLSAKIDSDIIGGKKVFNVNDGFLITCFADDIDETLLTEIAKKKPRNFVIKDSSLASDSASINFNQIFEKYSPKTTRKVL